MSSQECLVLIAYLNVLIAPKTEYKNRVPANTDTRLKPHRVEKVGRSTTHPRPKLKELLVDAPGNNGSDESNEWDTGPAVGNEILDRFLEKTYESNKKSATG